jgi:hypothetical protein
MFYIGDLYPNMASTTTRKQTLPEREEQRHYTEGKATPEAVTPETTGTVWTGILILVGVLVLLNLS